MPHRIHTLSNAGLWLIDGIVLGFAGILGVISQINLKEFTGPDGFLIAAILVVGVLWKNGQSRDKKDAELRERHHIELMEMQKSSHSASAVAQEKIAALTSESILASFKVAGEIKNLTSELEKRTCWAKLPKVE